MRSVANQIQKAWDRVGDRTSGLCFPFAGLHSDNDLRSRIAWRLFSGMAR